jgi:hypothetical protein
MAWLDDIACGSAIDQVVGGRRISAGSRRDPV